MHPTFWLEYLKERDNFRDRDIDVRIIFKLILNKQVMRALTIFIWLRIRPATGYCEHDN